MKDTFTFFINPVMCFILVFHNYIVLINHFKIKKTGNVRINVTMFRISVTNAAVERQYYIF